MRKRDGRKKCADGFYIQLDWFLLCPPRIHLGLLKETLLHNPAIDIKEDPFAPPRESLAYLKSQWKLSLSLSLFYNRVLSAESVSLLPVELRIHE